MVCERLPYELHSDGIRRPHALRANQIRDEVLAWRICGWRSARRGGCGGFSEFTEFEEVLVCKAFDGLTLEKAGRKIPREM